MMIFRRARGAIERVLVSFVLTHSFARKEAKGWSTGPFGKALLQVRIGSISL
jgi:hypothetical protein